MSLLETIGLSAINGENFSPILKTSNNYQHWISVNDLKRCLICAKNTGRIWLIEEMPYPYPPVHENCRCTIEYMKSILAGTATINGMDGADWWLKTHKKLPDYYITKQKLKSYGWKRGKSISDFISNKLLTKGFYRNANGHLPSAPHRIWYEADINYKTRKRNSQRILWSNDGLIFVTYDHYQTFYEII